MIRLLACCQLTPFFFVMFVVFPRRDFPKADRVLEKYLQVLKNIQERESESPQPVETHAAAEDDAKQQQQQQQHEELSTDLYDLVKGVLSTWPTRTRLALPEDPSTIEALLAKGGTIMRDHDRSHRDLQYLREHGSCTDHLIVKQPATVSPDAGRGAFAKRNLPAGSVVAPVPLIHLPERSVLDMYDDNHSGEPTHQQLLLNYCYGHAASTLLLCPYGVTSALVNHSREHANVKIVWSDKVTSHPEWREQPLEEWAYNYKTGLGFDYVALRDIAEGEEVLVDYGAEWQAAWDEHVANFKPLERRVDRLNEDFDSVLPTQDEWQWSMGDPYENSAAVNLWCRDIYREMRGLPELSPDEPDAWPCKVLLRQPQNDTSVVDNEDGTKTTKPQLLYTAEIVMRLQNEGEEDAEDEQQCFEVLDEVLFAVPRDAFVYGGAYEQDDTTRAYIQPWSFRHDLRIPDTIMPEAWKNLVEYEEEGEEDEYEYYYEDEDGEELEGSDEESPVATTTTVEL